MMDNTTMLFMVVLSVLLVLVFYKSPVERFNQAESENKNVFATVGENCSMGGKTCENSLWCISNNTGRVALPLETGTCKACTNINKNDVLSWGSICQ